MKRYILTRTVRSILSIFAVTTIAFLLVYSLVPRTLVFENDPVYSKLTANFDAKEKYKMQVWQRMGYLEYKEQKHICELYATDTASKENCINTNDSSLLKNAAEDLSSKGWTIQTTKAGQTYAHRDIPLISRAINWYKNLIYVDTTNYVNDVDNPNIKRAFYFGKTPAGAPALLCSGCKYKYQVYLSSSFPFIHQNWMTFSLGTSYPTYDGIPVLDVITDNQGKQVSKEQILETGVTSKTSANLLSCKYKATALMDHLDKTKFTDNYANCKSFKADPSMIGTSFRIGILALIMSYAIGLPVGIIMARKKEKWQDKLGTIYVNFIIAVPSLAFIYFMRFLLAMVGLPDKFPTLGAGNIRSYIPPVIILGLLGTSGLILWTRRYMADQMSSDYVKFARAKGLSEREIFNKHILRNAIIPIAHGFPGALIGTISGALMTETIFSIAGMGKMLPDSVTFYNNGMVIGLTFIFTALSIFAIFFGDVLITYVDPRISLTDKGGRS